MTLKNTEPNAVFTIENIQTTDEKSEPIKITTEGRFYQKNSAYYLLYTEYTELGDTSVLIRAAKDSVTIRRSGATNTKMEYVPGEQREVLYSVPFGNMVLDLKTNNLEVSLDENGGTIHLDYLLTAGGDSYHNDMCLSVELRTKN